MYFSFLLAPVETHPRGRSAAGTVLLFFLVFLTTINTSHSVPRPVTETLEGE